MEKKKYRINEYVQLRMTNEEGFVYDKKDEKIHIVNLTAYEVLEMLKDNKEVTEIIDEMETKYHVDRDILNNDIYETIQQFEHIGIVERVGMS